MKIYNFCLVIFSLFLLLSCEEEETKDMSGYVDFDIIGDNPAIVQVGTSYTDEGCVVEINGTDLTSEMQTYNPVDPNAMGIYSVDYTVNNEDEIELKASREVIVCNPTVSTDVGGTWISQEGTQRDNGGTIIPYSGYVVNIKYLAPGFFYIDDYLAGYYAQMVYPGYGTQLLTEGHFSLGEDNTLSLIDGVNNNWPNEVESLGDASYDPETGILKWEATWAGMIFTVILKKQ